MTLPFEIITESAEQTEDAGASLAKLLLGDSSLPRFIAMYGDLGVGKTAFVRGFTRAIAPDASVKSPTFALVNEYGSKRSTIYHFDMYRITDEDDLYSTGFYDYISGNAFCIVEWSENIPYAIPDSYLRVNIEKNSLEDTDSRLLQISYETDSRK
ncbi:MAG: tRNA (adenosine(37)-N6)-threonylcarbamoyltransferase complex ATPase subunit type 1 TsaE [Clostridia bacterium]|nr:tRNA (adenosine(37)-N6)-threonylcarbamoyltransferase complex ATPase subunit type 1 TsaE [Clostridia bacterium]